jgi:hypothetical protein
MPCPFTCRASGRQDTTAHAISSHKNVIGNDVVESEAEEKQEVDGLYRAIPGESQRQHLKRIYQANPTASPTEVAGLAGYPPQSVKGRFSEFRKKEIKRLEPKAPSDVEMAEKPKEPKAVPKAVRQNLPAVIYSSWGSA